MKIRVRIGTSCIAGQGLFTAQDIKKSTKVIRYTGEKINQAESDRRLAAGNVYIFGLDERYAIDGNTHKNTARYINHSCEPNAGLSAKLEMIALRDIKAGEELFWDYSTWMLERHWEMKCYCGSSQCRQVVRDFDLLPNRTQSKYLQLQIVAPFIQEYLLKKAWPLSKAS